MGQQRGGDLYQSNATAHQASCEAGKVADHAAAQSHDYAATLQTALEDALTQSREPVEALGTLAGRQDLRSEVKPRFLQLPFEQRQVMLGNVLVGNDNAFRITQARSDQICGLREQAGHDQHVIAAFSQAHWHRHYLLLRG